jgi:hypothetical protein
LEEMIFMRLIFAALSFVAVSWGALLHAQTSACTELAPRQAIEDLWNRSARGELLTERGWAAAAGFFVQPIKPFNNRLIKVVSNYYGVNSESTTGTKASVQMEFTDEGQIGVDLRYIPPPAQTTYKTSMSYNLVAGPGYTMMYGPDGKTLVEKKELKGVTIWRIEGPPPPPWGTVNSAIRYVLEARSRTKDPALKKNADETLAKLITLD